MNSLVSFPFPQPFLNISLLFLLCHFGLLFFIMFKRTPRIRKTFFCTHNTHTWIRNGLGVRELHVVSSGCASLWLWSGVVKCACSFCVDSKLFYFHTCHIQNKHTLYLCSISSYNFSYDSDPQSGFCFCLFSGCALPITILPFSVGCLPVQRKQLLWF